MDPPLTTRAPPPGDGRRGAEILLPSWRWVWVRVGVWGGGGAGRGPRFPAALRHEADSEDGPVPGQGLGAAQRAEAQLLGQPPHRSLLAKPSPVPQGQQDKGSLSSLAATEVPLPERLLRASRVGIPAAFDGSERVRMFLLRVAGTRGQCSKLSIMRSPHALVCGSPSEARARLCFGGGGGAVCGAPRVCAGLAGSARRSAPHQPPSFLGLHLPGDAQPGSDHPQVRVCLLCSVTGLVCLPVCRGAWLSRSSTLLCPCPLPLRSWVTAPT
ncbi:uncharacterized protein CFAP410 isoform X6 [Ursus maritimus]|uniref:Uncharacterized protein CFAP410 isoform X6 n=1 Tax=Ursus maritimus TaxID=29073 RepID=A0A8M1FAE2_URSMA|nr:uncharacterized protein CFAP410 isoform X6 [Ursus maritimus]XP_040477770.1 uncharacterized protein CFAP410 isoform X6 [Ursus maritimus]